MSCLTTLCAVCAALCCGACAAPSMAEAHHPPSGKTPTDYHHITSQRQERQSRSMLLSWCSVLVSLSLYV